MGIDVLVYRKHILRREFGGKDYSQSLLGGMMMLAKEDEADYELVKIGQAKLLFLGRIAGSEWAADNLDYGENDAACYIEPLVEGGFTVEKEDRLFWLMPDMVKAFQVVSVVSPVQMPESRLSVYHVQPLEQPFDFEEGFQV